jgi:hypothetical protein
MLAEQDGSERIKEMPKIPEWAKRGFSKLKIQTIGSPKMCPL